MHLSYLSYLLAFAASFAIVAAATPLFRTLALKRDIVDAPDGPHGRKHQHQPMPYLGGLAIALGFTLVVLGGAFLHRPLSGTGWLAAGVVLPALGLAIIGLLDDIEGLGVRSRFAAHRHRSADGHLVLLAPSAKGRYTQKLDSYLIHRDCLRPMAAVS